ncbi:UPF0193 protein EVG1 isoform X1 [Vespula pensylvanica]|uniref:Uncharacterized protein n=1 Tax=Vespula pensylvanica TaxID=30213 RepID=A0A834PE15_VESPE|nr:UPF0193 protein EVG1 isoform X1 [Vespula pensylvanica]KAF7438073.1 hypothetical protein H0235_000464 [Vespula pensylvanica]
MERNYQKVGMGVGAFHNPPRAKYSEETKNLIKLLMEESKVGMSQRKVIQDAVDKGESLPPPRKSMGDKQKSKEPQVMFPSLWKKRSQNIILNSGAYEREQYRRTAPLPNKEKQKRQLACLMAYGKEMPETPRGPKILHKARREPELNEDDPFEYIIEGIRERMEFLNDMECLGMGKKYRPIIQQEIAQKIRLMESIDMKRSVEVRKELQKFKEERPPPKPFPLGDLDEN